MLVFLSNGGMKVSQKVVDALEHGGGSVAFFSALGGIVSSNHDLIWAFGVCIGSIAAISGIILNLRAYHLKVRADRRAQELHDIEVLRLSQSSEE